LEVATSFDDIIPNLYSLREFDSNRQVVIDWEIEALSKEKSAFAVASQSQLAMFRRMSLSFAADLTIDSAMTLNQAKVGCDMQIRLLSGPACERLRDLGFCEQLQVRKLAGGRNLICSICGTRMAISRELAEQVLVSPIG
jgi:ferrous iron transport protein A